MGLDNKLIDELLAGRSTVAEIAGKNGLLKQLTKALWSGSRPRCKWSSAMNCMRLWCCQSVGIVERSFAWLEKCRRLWKNCERKLNTSLQMIHLAFLRLLLKRS